MIVLFFFGLGSMILFSLATTMLTEFTPKMNSAGVAVSCRPIDWNRLPEERLADPRLRVCS